MQLPLDSSGQAAPGTPHVRQLTISRSHAHLAQAGVGGGVGGQEHDLITGLDNALLHTAGQHITHTLDLVGTGDGQTQGGVGLALGHVGHVVQGVQQGVDLSTRGVV